jgi:hypothetical protein
MAHSYDYAVVKMSPDPIRDEALNVAIVVLLGNDLDVQVTPSPERLRAIMPSFEASALKELGNSLRSIDDPTLDTGQRIERLRQVPGVFVSDPGTLFAETPAELQGHVRNLVVRLLKASKAPLPLSGASKVTRLTKEISATFQREKLLGRGESALERHKVVRNVAVSTDGVLRADFVAKNKRMHVTETVDLRTDGDLTAARLKDIAVSAMTLDEAKRKFGRSTQRYFIYAGDRTAERQAKSYLRAAEYHCDHIFNFVSRDDRAKYLDFLLDALRGDLVGAAHLSSKRGPERKRARHR